MAGSDVSVSMRSTCRLKSSIMFSIRNVRPFHHPTAVGWAVVHEVQAPDLVGSRRLEELLLGASWKPLLGPATDVEPQSRVDPIDALVIPCVAHEP
jgi:hypothetical protein